MEFRKQAHAVYFCEYHIVFSTKYRHSWIDKGIFAYLELKLLEVRKHYPEIEYKVVNHDKDHVHLLVSIPPKMSVGSAIRIIKANTSREIKQKFPFLRDLYWGSNGVWSDGYFVSTVGITEEVIRKYIENQGKEDSGQARLDII